MNGRFCRHHEENSLIKDNTGSLLPFSAGVTLSRSQRVFPVRAQLKMLRPIFLSLSLFLVISGCGPSQAEMKKREQEKIHQRKVNSNFSIVKIEDCEYIVYEEYRSGGGGGIYSGICHKANCKNCSTKKITHE